MLLAMPCVALTSGIVSGQDGFYKTHNPSFTIGFQTGREQLFHTLPIYKGRKKPEIATHSSFVLRKTFNTHFKLETGLNYRSIPNNSTTIKGLDKKSVITTNKNQAAVPMTLQYYFVPAKSRLHAYCGAGVQYNLNTGAGNFPPFNASINPDSRAVAGTKYINVLITQGITFQINTRIQLTQSFHFIPGKDTAIGFDLGVGYDIR